MEKQLAILQVLGEFSVGVKSLHVFSPRIYANVFQLGCINCLPASMFELFLISMLGVPAIALCVCVCVCLRTRM